MRSVATPWALAAWDAEIVAGYLSRAAGPPPTEITMRPACARALVPVVADVAVRAADRLGPALAELDHARMRDAAIAVCIRRRLGHDPVGPPRDSRFGERILAALVHRGDPELRGALMATTVRLPDDATAAIDGEVGRILASVAPGAGAWIGRLDDDVRSATVEALLLDWTAARASALAPS